MTTTLTPPNRRRLDRAGQRAQAAVLPPPEREKRLDRGTGSGLGEPWRVIVLNDDHNTFEGVAFALSHTLPGVSYEQGLRLADRIHNTGRAIVWSGQQEQAELYWQELKDFGLTLAPLER